MAVQPFTAKEVQIFDIPGFAERMAAIRAEIRPKVEALGDALAPSLALVARVEIFPHVARHDRRTVNPPDDTWVAFGPDRRGYKKAPHFKVAVSRHALRFLFEVGPEFAAKPAFARAWKRQVPRLARTLSAAPGLGWFKNEHDEEPASPLVDFTPEKLGELADELTRTRDGQLVLGRAVPADEAARWTEAQYRSAALETFRMLAPLYRLR